MSYAIEKLGTIYYELAIGEGDIKQRLKDVQVELLCVTKKDLPTDLQEEWQLILNSLTSELPLKVNGENIVGAIPNTLSGMKKKTASAIARRMIALYFKAKDR